MRQTVAAGLLVLLASACAPLEVDEVDGGDPLDQGVSEGVSEAEQGLGACGGGVPAEGSIEALGMLDFLNSAAATLAVLDDQVALDARAAAGLVNHRNGPDGVLGTADDQPFTSVAGVDAIAYVNAAAILDLVDHARATWWIPLADGDCLGTFEGVTFTAAEGRRALALVNQASAARLGGTVGLTNQAVNGILGGRVLSDLPALARVPYVGPQSMMNIRSALINAVPGDLCAGTVECGAGLHCVGIPHDGSSSQGRCRDLTPIPGEGYSCDTTACGSGLFCSSYFSCLPGWMADSLTNPTDVTIPAFTSAPVESSVIVQGQATVPVDLEVVVAIDHPNMHALRLRLVDPNGTEALLWDGPASPGQTFQSHLEVTNGISRDDMVNGRWRLLIDNAAGAQVGLLRQWTLNLTSRWD
ncbi:proprotein convertase P-domain-containing protein [Chondromyces apiculatus]|nr:proprotein convertase P-domain-containing protein [Chondromyces apiculatus]